MPKSRGLSTMKCYFRTFHQLCGSLGMWVKGGGALLPSGPGLLLSVAPSCLRASRPSGSSTSGWQMRAEEPMEFSTCLGNGTYHFHLQAVG